MSDLSTFAGQTKHYAAVRERLLAPRLMVPSARPSTRSRYLLPKVRVKLQPSYGAPINLLTSPNARLIIRLVSLRENVPVDDIVGPRRHRSIVAARKAAISLVHTHCPHLSLPSIGRLFGNRDHTTILYSLGRTNRAVVNPQRQLTPAIPNDPQNTPLQTLKPESFRANQSTI